MKSEAGWLVRLRRRGPGLVLRGLCMGAADVVPGVSGGTIALITGIYDELIRTVAGVDAQAGRLLLRGHFGQALERLNAAFLGPLLLGIGVAILSLARLISYLLAVHPEPVWGFFTGLILASALFVGRQIGVWRAPHVACLLAGGLGGFALTSLVPMQTGAETYKYVVAGMVAIVAMILPGISGSFLLVVLGKYEQVLTAVHTRQVGVLVAFGAGCAVGALLFSRLLRALLARCHGPTMAFLVGLMLGSLRKVWPFRQVLEQEVLGARVVVLRDQCVWPDGSEPAVVLSFSLMVLGVALVWALEWLSRRR